MKNKKGKNEVRVKNYIYGMNEKYCEEKIIRYGHDEWIHRDYIILADELGVSISLGELINLWEKSKGYQLSGGVHYNKGDSLFEIYEYGGSGSYYDTLYDRLSHTDAWKLIKRCIKTAKKYTSQRNTYDTQNPNFPESECYLNAK